jgi:hypothetical protein
MKKISLLAFLVYGLFGINGAADTVKIPAYQFQVFAADTELNLDVPGEANVVIVTPERIPITVSLPIIFNRTKPGLFTTAAREILIDSKNFVQSIIFMVNSYSVSVTATKPINLNYMDRFVTIFPIADNTFSTIPTHSEVALVPSQPGVYFGTMAKEQQDCVFHDFPLTWPPITLTRSLVGTNPAIAKDIADLCRAQSSQAVLITGTDKNFETGDYRDYVTDFKLVTRQSLPASVGGDRPGSRQ